MQSSKEKTGASSVFYILGGVVIGAACGLLFAPKKGSEFRADIDELGKKGREKGQELYSRVKKMIPIGMNGAKEEGSELLQEAQEGVASTTNH